MARVGDCQPGRVRVVGMDVGARRLHAVALDGRATVVGVATLLADDRDAVLAWTRGADAVAVDSPDRWSTAPHRTEEELPPKFRTARCAEIALARDRGIWVPWTTPTEPVAGWIQVGIDVFAALGELEPVETYPHAVFRVLAAGRRLPRKQTHSGALARVELLEQARLSAPSLEMWSHDALDAAAAALVALHRAGGTAVEVSCGHDGSAMWLPGECPPPSG